MFSSTQHFPYSFIIKSNSSWSGSLYFNQFLYREQKDASVCPKTLLKSLNVIIPLWIKRKKPIVAPVTCQMAFSSSWSNIKSFLIENYLPLCLINLCCLKYISYDSSCIFRENNLEC